MKLTYSQKVLFVSVIILVVIIAADIVLIHLLSGKISDIDNKVRQLDISSQERERDLSLRDSVASSVTERERLSGYFVGPSNTDTVDFTEYLELLALESKVSEKKTLEAGTVAGLQSPETLSSLHYRISVSGRWSDVYGFLQKIESLPKIVRINSVSFSLNAETSTVKGLAAGKAWSADLDLTVLKLKN